MLIGIIGAPNKGKSTLFSALTSTEVPIADYPFTTIDPNKGVCYATKECAEKKLNTKCNARNSLCTNGIRMLPTNIIDVAGLVEGAHSGKGMGNQFLNDLSAADAFMLVVDASGSTDKLGNRAEGSDPVEDIRMVIRELNQWLFGIIKRHMPTVSKSRDPLEALGGVLSSIRAGKDDIAYCMEECSIPGAATGWSDSEMLAFAESLLKKVKPIVIIANKADAPNAKQNTERLVQAFPGMRVFECSAAIELALSRARSGKLIDYMPGSTDLKITDGSISSEKRKALEYMEKYIGSHSVGTGIQAALNSIVFDVLDNIVVYPVEDEHKYTDHFGNVLPDAVLLKRGSRAYDLAAKIHTELASKMIYAIDAVRKMRLGKEHVLNDNDVIRIVSAAKL